MKKSKISSVIEFAMAVVVLNLLFLVCSIPLITFGTSLTALYSGLRALIKKEPYLRAFFNAFRTGFVRSTIAWLILAAINAVPLLHTWYIYGETTHNGQALSALPTLLLSALFVVVLLTITTMVFLLYSRFECTVSQMLRYGTWLTLSNPLRALPIGLLTWAPLFLLIYDAVNKTFLILLIFTVWLFFYFAVVGIAAIWLMNRPFILFAREELGMNITNQINHAHNKKEENQ